MSADIDSDGNRYARLAEERERLRATHLGPDRPASRARGVHHVALLSGGVERTIRFYQDLLEFPLTEIVENRRDPGSSYFFFDVGNGNLLAFFDLPDADLSRYAEVLGGLHHIAISVAPARWSYLKARLDGAGVPYHQDSGTSVAFRDPDGARVELIADPLGDTSGMNVA